MSGVGGSRVGRVSHLRKLRASSACPHATLCLDMFSLSLGFPVPSTLEVCASRSPVTVAMDTRVSRRS
eukprot:490446-Pleurochrysis_carterae.AAC.3